MEVLNEDDQIEENEELTEKNNKKKSLITFAKLNKLFIIPFLFAILNFLSILFEDLIRKEKILKNPPFIKSFFYDFTNILVGLFHFLSYVRTNVDIKKESSNDKEGVNDSIDYIDNESLSPIYNSKTIIMFILLLSLMIAIDDLLCILIEDNDNVFDERLFYLFFIPLFSKIILKENIYRHHYLSLLISLISGIFLIIPICLEFNSANDTVQNILDFVKGINFPLFLVIVKYIVEKYFISPLKIILIVGIISLIINLIGYTIYSLIINDFSLFTDCFDFSQVENKLAVSINLILYILFLTASQLALYLSIFYFSPTLITVTDIISPLFMWIISNFDEEAEIIEEILCPIGYLTTIFSTLIYNELIIFNCCGLNKNTKKFVNKRITKEIREIQKSEEILQLEFGEDSLMNDNN